MEPRNPENPTTNPSDPEKSETPTEQTPPAPSAEQAPPTPSAEQTPPAPSAEQTSPAPSGEQRPPAEEAEETAPPAPSAPAPEATAAPAESSAPATPPPAPPTPEAPAAPVPDAATEEEVSDEEFDKLLEEYGTVEEIGSGEIVMATVVSIMTDSVLVDLGAKSEGIVPIDEFKDANGNLTVKEGDRIDVVAGSKDPETGQVKASRRKARMQAALAQLEAALAGDDPLTGQVARAVKNGVIVDLGLECFMPASHIDLRRVGNLDEWVGKEVEVMVLELNRGRKRAVVSRRSWLERHQRAQREKFFAEHGEGSTVTGTVKNLTDFGVFVDLGGFDGLIPRDELSWERGLQPSDVVSPDQEITCQVVKVNLETGKITLSRKRLTPDPWETITERYKRGDVVDAVIVNTTDYGAFARLEEGLTGLIHASDLSWTTRRKKASDFVNEGDHVKAQVLEVDTEKRRLSLGLKQIQPDPWAALEREMPPGSKVKGKVTSVTNFGIFVQLRPEVEGLIHQSDLSWESKGIDPRETAKEGDEIEAVVLRVDRVNRKISLGSKQLTDSPYVKWCKEHPVRSHVTGKVTRVVSFGAFVELTPGVEGLVHISHLSNDRVEKVEDVAKPGEEVTVKVIKAEPKREKINLSIRDYLRDQERREIEQYTKTGKKTHGGSNLGELLRQAGLQVTDDEES